STLNVANALRGAIIKCYYLETRRLKRRLTFTGVETILADLENQLYQNIFIPGERTLLSKQFILEELNKIREIIIYQHNGLFLHLVDNLINKVHVFGLHFASLDIRQDSVVHNEVLKVIAGKSDALPDNYPELSEEEKLNCLTNISKKTDPASYSDGKVKDALDTINIIRDIQLYNGTEGCNRYIISRCNSALNVLEVYGLFLLCGWEKDKLGIDIVPLFETVDDLQKAANVMKTLYQNEVYSNHLRYRQKKQTIMLGFSDGTKDGGYLMANWSIYKTKKELTGLSKEFGFDVVFFDGRGGPPARGGGKTHKFYASMGKEISNKEIQLTIQGQTVSSNFGTIDSAQFNIEQLLNAGISNELFSTRQYTLEKEEEVLLEQLANESFKSYSELKNHPDFLNYLSHVSPLKFYAATNIGSRPAKRSSSSTLSLKDLRAIPFVGAWSQLKQNVTGYYGVGSALQQLDKLGKLNEIKNLYHHSLFFKTLMDNCEMAMQKCFFPLTQFLSEHPRFGEFWNKIYQEYELTQRYLFQLSGKNELMADYPVEQLSVQMREKIVLPLTTIQQYSITKARELEEQLVNTPIKSTYEKLAMRCSFGIINAGRNSA
ncbi:MAG: phosphoenolpyruvate carboxylase, partial [Bacteroidota bacterium]|nr:phosphoenolpyruvate carboxylase [Bacteroidota bacterium]